MSIIVRRNATIYSFVIFLQTALHVSDDTLIHHQEHIQTVITTSGTGRWWMEVSSETCRAACRNIIKLNTVAFRWTGIDLQSTILCPWFCASWINVNNCPTKCDYIQFCYISADSSTCFGWYLYPPSTSARCNYSLNVLLMMVEGIIRNM